MPYVLYDSNGQPTGLCIVAQYRGHKYVPDDHADVVAYQQLVAQLKAAVKQRREQKRQRIAVLKQSANPDVVELATLLENGR